MSEYRTPEEAARSDIPERYAKAVSVLVSPSGDSAVVLLLTNEEPYIEPYQMVCLKDGDAWRSGSGRNGMGWSELQPDTENGVVTCWDEVPGNVVEVVVRSGAEDFRVETNEGFFLFCRWDVGSEAPLPYVKKHVRADGSEIDVEAPFYA